MWKFILTTAATAAFLWFCSHRIVIGSTALPAPGPFFSPYHGFWQQAEKISPRSKKISLISETLTDSVRILFDERLVPHIFAKNTRDAYYAQGYITAMHRLWQMDIGARATAGRIAEVAGPAALNYDRGQRNRGVPKAAELALAKWKTYPDDFALLEAYTLGINDYIGTLKPRDYPLEFKLMGYAPEPWSPYKTALFAKSMASTLNSQERDLEYSNLRQALGDSIFAMLYPVRNPKDSPVIPQGTKWNFDPVKLPGDTAAQLPLGHPAGSGITGEPSHEGSNNWAIGTQKSAGDYPILCNDPHLRLTLPSIWYEIQIVTDSMNTYGASFPGFHSVILGWNEHLAWGSTNVGQDFTDWYSIEWTDTTKSAYMLDGKPTLVEYREEIINVRGQADYIDTISYTVWGPVMKDGPHAGLAMRWISHAEPDGPELSLFTRINSAKSKEEFENALDVYFAPAQNFVYADVEGNIGMFLVGRFPLRGKGSTGMVLNGSSSSQGWQGYVPARHNPKVINPGRGYVASANQQSTDDTYPYFYDGSPYFEDYRGRYLNRKLQSLDGVSEAEMMSLQSNNYSLKAEDALPSMLAQLDADNLNGRSREVFDTLGHWNNQYEPDLHAPVYFDLWFHFFQTMVWDEIALFSDSMRVVMPEDWRLIDLMLEDPQNEFFDIIETPGIEDFSAISKLSFQAAIDSLEKLEGNPDWGTYRSFDIVHLANIAGLDQPVDYIGGHGDALNAIKGQAGPSWRMVVSLKDRPEAKVVYPGGQSGNAGSPYYNNMVDTWSRGEYFNPQFVKKPSGIDSVRMEITMFNK